MLKKETADKLKTTFGFDVDKLIAAIKDEAEVDYVMPEDVTVIKTADLEIRDNTKIADGKKQGETIGEAKGKEISAKAFRKKFSLEDALGSDIDKIVEATNTKLNKGDVALQEQVAGLLKDKETLTLEVAGEKTKSKQSAFDSSLIQMFPAGRNADLNDAERLALIKMNLQFEEADGKTTVKKNGVLQTDPTTHAPLGVDKVIADLFTEKKWNGAAGGSGGRGGENNPGGGGTGGIKKLSAFTEKWKVENPGKNEISPEFTEVLNKHAKENVDFDFYS